MIRQIPEAHPMPWPADRRSVGQRKPMDISLDSLSWCRARTPGVMRYPAVGPCDSIHHRDRP